MSDGPISNFRLLRLIRDAASTKNAERELLYALALRANTHKKFICWPSYDQLGHDTQLNETTLKRAARRLEGAGLIKRSVRVHRSNIFFINVPLLLSQAAAAKKAREDAKASAEDEIKSPFDDVSIDDHQNTSDEDGDGDEGSVRSRMQANQNCKGCSEANLGISAQEIPP